MTDFKGIRIVYAMTGSFCTFSKAFRQMENLIALGADIQPLMSFNASTIDTRFGKASEHIAYAEKLSGKKVITDISGAEPIGPKHMADIVLVAPCTGNTLAKIANNIVDTSVTMAVKSHLRNTGAVVLCIATNDGLAGSAKNIISHERVLRSKLFYQDFFSQSIKNGLTGNVYRINLDNTGFATVIKNANTNLVAGSSLSVSAGTSTTHKIAFCLDLDIFNKSNYFSIFQQS